MKAAKVLYFLKHRHMHTLFAFAVILAAQYLLPLLALPFLSPRLGADLFGVLLYMLNISIMVSIFVDWGFSFGAVREAAKNRLDAKGVWGILCGVLGAKIILSLFCLSLAGGGMFFLPYARAYPGLYWLAVVYGIVLGNNPTWFFQGVGEGMRRMAAMDVGGGAAALFLTVLTVKGPQQAICYPLFLVFCKGLTYGWQTIAAFTPYGPVRADLRGGCTAIRQTMILFFSRVASMTYTQLSVLIMGGILSPAQLGIFVVADKVARAIVSLSNPVTQTLFPEVCVNRGADAGKTTFILRCSFIATAASMVVASACIYFAAPWVMRIVLGAWREGAQEALQAFVFMIPLYACNIVLGTQTLVSHGLERLLTFVLALVGVCSLPVLIFLASSYGLAGAVWVPALVEGAIFIGLALCVAKYCPQAFFRK